MKENFIILSDTTKTPSDTNILAWQKNEVIRDLRKEFYISDHPLEKNFKSTNKWFCLQSIENLEELRYYRYFHNILSREKIVWRIKRTSEKTPLVLSILHKWNFNDKIPKASIIANKEKIYVIKQNYISWINLTETAQSTKLPHKLMSTLQEMIHKKIFEVFKIQHQKIKTHIQRDMYAHSTNFKLTWVNKQWYHITCTDVWSSLYATTQCIKQYIWYHKIDDLL